LEKRGAVECSVANVKLRQIGDATSDFASFSIIGFDKKSKKKRRKKMKKNNGENRKRNDAPKTEETASARRTVWGG